VDGASEKDQMNDAGGMLYEPKGNLKKKAGEANGIGNTAAY